MTAEKIQPVVMDPYEFLDDGYSRLDHMDGLGMRPGMIRGPQTGLPIPAPEPQLSWDDMSWRERVDSIKPGLIATTWLVAAVTILGSIAMVIAASLNGVLR